MDAEPIQISIIIPTYHRPRQLKDCLSSLSKLQFDPAAFEVIVVDDGGVVSLMPIVDSYRDLINVRLIRQPNRGPGVARNNGAAHARGHLLAFIDDDCRAHPMWLGALKTRHDEHPDRLMGGRTINALDRNLCSAASQLILDTAYTYYNGDSVSPKFFTSNNMAVPARRFRSLGGFDDRFRTTEDRELCDRWLHNGGTMMFVPQAKVYHAHKLGLGAYLLQQFGYGRGAFRYHRIRADQGRGRLEIDLSFYGTHLIKLKNAITGYGLLRGLNLFLLMVLWQIANTGGYFWEKVISGEPAQTE
jgi:glycosyltransferase involved in cell wall biosynthesis